jgi:hypothetical protein
MPQPPLVRTLADCPVLDGAAEAEIVASDWSFKWQATGPLKESADVDARDTLAHLSRSANRTRKCVSNHSLHVATTAGMQSLVESPGMGLTVVGGYVPLI